MSAERNALCKCGSGLKYKKCHYDMDNASPILRPIESQKFYTKNWLNNAQHFSTHGYYEWMASKLKHYQPSLILDIGCGEGSGILELKKTFSNASIISIDENLSCIQTAKNILEKENLDVTVINRLLFEGLDKNHHQILIETGKLKYEPGIMLIGADILLADDELMDYLNSLGKFDAVTIWLIGSHTLRTQCVNIEDLNIKTVGEYRLRVQNRVYEIADKVLKKGGVLQVVDRGEEPNSDLLKYDILDAHRRQASSTELEVYELDYFPYTEPISKTRVTMEDTPPLSRRIPSDKKAILSIISIKK